MNRREFTASLAAAMTAPVLPLTAATSSGASAVALPNGTYMWADFIARARGHVDVGFLARRLNLTSAQALQVMQELVRNGAVRSAGFAGLAQATKPFKYPTATNKSATAELWERMKTLDQGTGAQNSGELDISDSFSQIRDEEATPSTSEGQPELNHAEFEDDDIPPDFDQHSGTRDNT